MTDTRHQQAARLRAEGATHAEIADAVGVSTRTVERWQGKGLLPDPPDGPDASKNGDGPEWSLTEARRRKEIELALKHKRERLKDETRHVPLDEITRQATEWGLRVQRLFRLFPVRHGPDLAQDLGVDGADLQIHLDEAIAAFLREAADEFNPRELEDDDG
jgi:transposase